MDGHGAADGFSAAFDQHAPAVLGYARRRLDNQEAAWDVVSDTFTAAWRHWQRRPADEQLLPWLYAIAANAVRDKRRAAGRRDRLVSRLVATQPPRHEADPADAVIARQALREALSRLPDADLEVLRLVAWEGLTDARSLGLALGVSPGTARARVHRARRRLKAQLTDAREQPALAAPSAASSRASEA